MVPKTFTSSRGSASTSGYDSLDNVLRETQRILPAGPIRTVTATYDARGNQTGLVYPGGRSFWAVRAGAPRRIVYVASVDAE